VATSPPVSARIDAGGLTLVVHDWGGDGAPVLLAHPTGFHGLVWVPVARALVAAGHRVWSFDFRGHGDSDPSPDGYRWARFADDAESVGDHLGILGDGSLLGVGHSKGAAALLLLEARRPGSFGRLWCYEPIVFPTDDALERDDDAPLAVSARKRRAIWPSKDEAATAFASRPPLDVLDPEVLHAYVEHGLTERTHGMVGLKCRPEYEAEVYAEMTTNGVYSCLRDVRCPTLIACGETTDAIVPKLGQMVVDRLPDARLEVLPGVGHFGPMQDPATIVSSILGFSSP
jgi:pimeloyl-ACP methyl ester carboxylesterase